MLYILIVCLNILNLNKLNLKKIKKTMYKELNEEIRNPKSDFHNKIIDSKEEHHNWINTKNIS